jgi:pimeloyl-ACP methyl ester carboxylesterase
MATFDVQLPSAAAAWHQSGEMLSIHGLEIFFRRVNAGTAGVPTVFLHGFPSSSFDFYPLDPLLGAGERVYFDFPGYGLSAKPNDYSYSLFEQADIVEGLLAKLGIHEAHVLAHDMGTSVACELAARHNRGLLGFRMRSLILMNGSVHLELAQLTPSQKLLRSPLGRLAARLSSGPAFKAQLRRILAKPVSGEELEAMWQLMRYRDGHLRLPDIIRYLDERTRFAHRWIGALTELSIPVGIIWGRKDPVAVAAIAEALAREIPTAKLTWLPNLGHYPQLEEPQAVAVALIVFYEFGKG